MDLHQAQILPGDPGPIEGLGHRVGRSHEELPAGIHRGHGVAPDRGEGTVAQRPRLVLRHQQHRRGAIGERRGVARGHRAVAAVEHRLQLGQRLQAGVAAGCRCRWSVTSSMSRATEPGGDLGGQPAVGGGRRRRAGGSAAPGGPGRRGRCRFPWPSSRPTGPSIRRWTARRSRASPAPGPWAGSSKTPPSRWRQATWPCSAATRVRLIRRECRIGMSDSDSTPPASTTSAWPRRIWSCALVMAWPAEAQARFRL